MNKKLIKNIYRATAILTTLVVAFSGVYYFSRDNTPSASAYKIDECLTTLVSTVEWRTLEFNAFLDIHFASKKNNTYLISDAIKAYIEYKKSVLSAMSQYDIGVATLPVHAEEIDACMRIVDQKLNDAKKMLSEHVKNTSGVKHGQIMIEKYRAVNKQLADLNVEIGKIAGAFEGFYQKFPGYSEDCLTSE